MRDIVMLMRSTGASTAASGCDWAVAEGVVMRCLAFQG
ncbi:putative lipoprotein [Eggerthella sp. HGA1]|nr:putative lipoprotein [Eggerthella sp. HGA1]